MSTIATTKLSSKGQVVIPERIRKKLGLEPGTEFVVLGDKDVVVLKTVKAPSSVATHIASSNLGGLVTTGEDMVRYMTVVLAGGDVGNKSLIRPDIISEVQRPQSGR